MKTSASAYLGWAHNEYAQSLIELLTLRIATLATMGWTPDDLRHELSTRIDPLLFMALPTVLSSTPSHLVTIWRRDVLPSQLRNTTIGALEKMLSHLNGLGSLDEWALLCGQDPHEREAMVLSGLSTQQRKAHHKVQGLLKKAESTSFEKEAEVLIAKAEQLRQQYRIESLSSASNASQTNAGLVSTRIRLTAPWIKHQFNLLSTVAHAHSCASLLLTSSGICTVIGTSDDATHVLDLFGSLNRQRDHFMRQSPGAQTAKNNNETSNYRRSFMIAYSSNIGLLLKKAAEDAIDSLSEPNSGTRGAAVSLLADRHHQANLVMREIFPHTKTFQLRSYHSSGYRDGHNAAARSHLGGDSAGLKGMSSLNFGARSDSLSA